MRGKEVAQGKMGENTRGCVAEQTNNSRRGTASHFAKWDVSEQTLQKHHASKQSIVEGIYLLAPSHLLSFTVKFLPHGVNILCFQVVSPGEARSHTQRHNGSCECGRCGNSTEASGGRTESLERI